MPTKLCPKCATRCGPRSFECKNCHFKFTAREKKVVPVSNPNRSKPFKTCPNASCQEKCGPRTLNCPKCQTPFVIKTGVYAHVSDKPVAPELTAEQICAAQHQCREIVSTPGRYVSPKLAQKSSWLTVHPQGDSKDAIFDWLDEITCIGYSQGRYYTADALIYFAQSIWSVHNKEEWNHIKSLIREWDTLRLEEAKNLPVPRAVTASKSEKKETINLDEEVDDPLIAEVDGMF